MYCWQAVPSHLMYSLPISFTTTGSCTLSMLCSCWRYYSQGTHHYHPSCVLQSNPCRPFCHTRSAGLDDSECLYSLDTGSQPGRCWMLDGCSGCTTWKLVGVMVSRSFQTVCVLLFPGWCVCCCFLDDPSSIRAFRLLTADWTFHTCKHFQNCLSTRKEWQSFRTRLPWLLHL